MNIFNRREVFLTRDSNSLSRARNVLESNNIKYKLQVDNLTNPGRYRGMPGIRAEAMYEYRIYVHKSDYEQAIHVIRK